MTKVKSHEENYKEMKEDLKEIRLGIFLLLDENRELKIRNEELEKENERLHDLILQLS